MSFQRLSVSPGGHHIVNADGSAFFYLADTAWELFHRLDAQQAKGYLKTRAQQGFTAIQAVALAEFDGIRTPNAYGRRPLLQGDAGEWDVTRPDVAGEYSYWDHVDYIIETAGQLGLYIALLPTWGDKFSRCWGVGPQLFTPENAAVYGEWIGRRYAHCPNLIWVLGGDRVLATRAHFEIIHHMARAIRAADGGSHLITFHPNGGQSSADPLHGEDWLDFHMIQSGHERKRYNYAMIQRDYARVPPKPVLDGEPGYEDHPEAFNPENGYLDAADVRQFAYMSLLSGACGHTYGHHSVWGMISSIPAPGFSPAHFATTWQAALDCPGGRQMQHVKHLLMQRNFLSGAPAPALIREQLGGVLHIPVLKGDTYLIAYTAQGRYIHFVPGYFDGRPCTAQWVNPRTGQATPIGRPDDARDVRFDPPSGGRGNDWVLVLDAL